MDYLMMEPMRAGLDVKRRKKKKKRHETIPNHPDLMTNQYSTGVFPNVAVASLTTNLCLLLIEKIALSFFWISLQSRRHHRGPDPACHPTHQSRESNSQ